MCKHVAAVLYGIGARLDEQPDLLFALRKVDQQDLIARAGKGLAQTGKGPKAGKVLDESDLSEMFGIEMAQPAPRAAAVRNKRASRMDPVTSPEPAAHTAAKSAAKAAPIAQPMTAAKRMAVAKRMKEYWRARRSRLDKTPR
jgi:uncharacterized Zn finger protein